MAIVTVGKKACAVNPLKMSQPIGGAFAFLGLRGSMPLLHGSQGCATYIRRYLISHTKEPLDIASSSFGEAAAIFPPSDVVASLRLRWLSLILRPRTSARIGCRLPRDGGLRVGRGRRTRRPFGRTRCHRASRAKWRLGRRSI